MNINWTYYPANNFGSFHQNEAHRGFIESEYGMVLIAIIFKDEGTWFVSIEDTLNSDEFQAVHHKLNEILANDLRTP